MVRVAGLEKVPVVGPFLNTPLGMITGGLVLAQTIGMVTGKFNLIPNFVKRSDDSKQTMDYLATNYPDSKSKYAGRGIWGQAAVANQLAKGIGGVRFGSRIQGSPFSSGSVGAYWVNKSYKDGQFGKGYAPDVSAYKIPLFNRILHSLRY